MCQPYIENATALSDNYAFLLFPPYPIGPTTSPSTPRLAYSPGNNSPTTQPNNGSSEPTTGYHLIMIIINNLNNFN